MMSFSNREPFFIAEFSLSIQIKDLKEVKPKNFFKLQVVSKLGWILLKERRLKENF